MTSAQATTRSTPTPPHRVPADRRATRPVPTDAGRRLLAQVDDVRRDASERVLDVLTPAQRRTLHEILAVVVGEDL